MRAEGGGIIAAFLSLVLNRPNVAAVSLRSTRPRAESRRLIKIKRCRARKERKRLRNDFATSFEKVSWESPGLVSPGKNILPDGEVVGRNFSRESWTINTEFANHNPSL